MPPDVSDDGPSSIPSSAREEGGEHSLPPATRLENLIGARINSKALGGTAQEYWKVRGSASAIKAEIVQAELDAAEARLAAKVEQQLQRHQAHAKVEQQLQRHQAHADVELDDFSKRAQGACATLPPATRLEVLIGARINSDLLGGTAEQYWHARGSAGEIKAEIVQAEQAEADAHAKPAKKKLTRVMPSEAVLQSFNQAGGGGAAAAGSSSGAAADDMELQRPPSATSVRSDPGPIRPGAFGGPGRAKTMPRVAWDDAQVTSAVVHAQTASQFGVVPPPNRLESLIGARIRSKLLRGTAEAAQAGRQAAIAERPDEE